MEITKENIKELVGREFIHKDGDVRIKIESYNDRYFNIRFNTCAHELDCRFEDEILEYIKDGTWILIGEFNITEQTPTHYDNTNGSLYLFAEQHGLNAWEFEVIKRTVRCRKKGEFISDIEKTIEVLKLYLKEQGEKYNGQIEKLNK